MITKGMFTSNKEDWETPQDLFEKLNEEFHFTLDAAANEKNAKCAIYYTEKEDALKQNWNNEIIWCNPPYGKKIKSFVEKAFYTWLQYPKTTVVMLLPARTDTKWFHDYVYKRAEIRFLKGRLHFSNSKNAAPFPSMVAIWEHKEMQAQRLQELWRWINGRD